MHPAMQDTPAGIVERAASVLAGEVGLRTPRPGLASLDIAEHSPDLVALAGVRDDAQHARRRGLDFFRRLVGFE
jgi:hypothetical protein